MVSPRTMDEMLEYAQQQEAAILRDRTRKPERGIQSIQRKGQTNRANKKPQRCKANDSDKELQGTLAEEIICGFCKNRGHQTLYSYNRPGNEHLLDTFWLAIPIQLRHKSEVFFNSNFIFFLYICLLMNSKKAI